VRVRVYEFLKPASSSRWHIKFRSEDLSFLRFVETRLKKEQKKFKTNAGREWEGTEITRRNTESLFTESE